MADNNAAIVTAIYQAIAGGRSPSSSDLTTYTAQIANSGATSAQVATAIENSAFVQNVVNPIIREYQAAFGRVPDQAGLTYWTAVAAPNGPGGAIDGAFLTGIAGSFANSAEFQARYGSGLTASTVVQPANTALVTALYSNVLGRSPDLGGMAYWLNAGATLGQMLTAFANSAEFTALAAGPITAFQSREAVGSAPSSGSLLGLTTFGTQYVLGPGGSTITNLPSSATIDLADTGTGANVFSPTVGATIVNINLGTATSAGVIYGSETIRGFKTVNLNAISGSLDTGHTITFINDDNTTFNVTGTELTKIILSAGTSVGVTVNGSGSTGGVNVVGSAQGDVLIGGSGQDTFTTGAKAGSLKGNAGRDLFDVHNTVYGTGTQIETINDFVAKTDSIGLIKQGATAFVATAVVAAAGAGSIGTAINAAVSALADGSTNAQVDWFQFGGDTYVVESVSIAHTTVATADLVVKLVGLVDLSGSAITAATTTVNGYTPSLLS